MFPSSPASSSIGQLVAEFLVAKRAQGCTPRTVVTYAERLAPFVAWVGEQPITRATLRAYLARLRSSPRLSAISVAGRFRAVAVLCSWLVEEGHLAANPAIKLTPKVPKRLPASYSVAQIHRLLAVCGPRDRAIVIVLLDTGLRAAECLSLKRGDLGGDGRFRIMGKGQKERAGQLSPAALDAVAAYLATRSDDHPALWLGRGGPLKYAGLYQIIRRRAREAGIRGDVRWLLHSFRATFACLFMEHPDADLETLRRLLGHESTVMSAHYAQLALDRLVERKKAHINPLGAVLDS